MNIHYQELLKKKSYTFYIYCCLYGWLVPLVIMNIFVHIFKIKKVLHFYNFIHWIDVIIQKIQQMNPNKSLNIQIQ